MDNLDLIRDDELRRRLMQYGFPNLPVTSTSRKILIKKLRNYMDNEKVKLRRETTNAIRYSSDEDGPSERDNKLRKRGTVSAVIGDQHNSSMPPPLLPVKRSYTSFSPSSPSPSTSTVPGVTIGNRTTNSKSRSSVYVSPILQGAVSETDEDSDLNSENISSSSRNSYVHRRTGLGSSTALPKRSPLRTLRNSSFGYSSETDGIEEQITFRIPFNGLLNQSGSEEPQTEQPFLSDFTRRLLNLRGSSVANSKAKQISPIVNSHRGNHLLSDATFHGESSIGKTVPIMGGIVHQANHSHMDRTNVPVSTALSRFLVKVNEQYGVKQTFVPCVLLSALIIFFAFVAFMYLTISPDLANVMTTQETKFKPCDTSALSTNLATRSGYDCIEKSQIDSALDLLRDITEQLRNRIEQHKCVDSSISYTMGAKEVINFALEKNPHLHVMTIMKDLHNMEYLIQMNPQWRVKHCNADGTTLSLDEVKNLRSTQENYFAISSPKLPLMCSIYNKLQTFFFLIGGIGIVASILFVGYMVVQYVIRTYQSRKELVDNLISDIINALIEKSTEDPTNTTSNAIVVQHLRDKLIPPTKRKQWDWAWNAAIDFLENNESRIQFEIGTRNGEECKMMRWIDSVAPPQQSPVKRWQSPAFDKTNKIKDPPTPCLKIRQMFNRYEVNNPNLKQIIQDAILEKAGIDCKIYNIELDKNNCCVYVRCASSEDAGIVHDQINGWWFDGSLVSIKFLRLDRYMTRFPKSPAGPKCLRPSNKKFLSMSNYVNDEAKTNGAHEGDYEDDDEF